MLFRDWHYCWFVVERRIHAEGEIVKRESQRERKRERELRARRVTIGIKRKTNKNFEMMQIFNV